MVLSENYMQKPRGIPYFLVKTTSVEVNISSTSPQHFRTICGLVVRVIYRYTLNIYLHIGYIRTPWTENPFLSKQYNYERWRLFTWLMYNMMGFYRFLWVSCRFPTFFPIALTLPLSIVFCTAPRKSSPSSAPPPRCKRQRDPAPRRTWFPRWGKNREDVTRLWDVLYT